MTCASIMNIFCTRVSLSTRTCLNTFPALQASKNYLETMERSHISKEVLKSRQKLQAMLPTETHRIAGVTFEDRQYLVSKLVPGLPLIFEREPDNQYDANAVVIRMLDGRKLGYIPKQETSSFIHNMCLGKVRSTGQNQNNGKLGCFVDVQTKLPPVVNLSIPEDLIGPCRALTSHLKGESWDELKRKIFERMGGKCSITGAKTRNVEARWFLQCDKRVVKLVGFVLQDESLREILYTDQTIKDEEDVCVTMAVLNGIREEDAFDLFMRQLELSNVRYHEGWKLDLSYLHEIGIDPPTM